MKRLLCRIFAVLALVAGVVMPSAGLAFADPSTDTTVVTMPPVPTVPPVQAPPVPVLPTQGADPPVNPTPQAPVVNPIPVQNPNPVPQPAPVITPVAPAPVPVVVPSQAPQQVPLPVKIAVSVPQPSVQERPAPAPVSVSEQPTVAPKPAPQPVPVQSTPPVVPTTRQVQTVPNSKVATPIVPTVRTEAPREAPVTVPPIVKTVPQIAASTGTAGGVDQPPAIGNHQLPPPGEPNDASPVIDSSVADILHDGASGSHSQNLLPEATVQTQSAVNQNSNNTTIDAPRQLPSPGPSNPFPNWGYNPPVEVTPLPVPGYGGGPCGTPGCNNNGPGPIGGGCGTPPCSNSGPGNCGTPPCSGSGSGNCGMPSCSNPGPPGGCGTPPCGGPGSGSGCGAPPCGPPPPIIPNRPVYNPWQNGNHQLPPPNPNIFVRADGDGQVMFINNVTQINNTAVNNAPAIVYLTNFNTNRVLSFNANFGSPLYLSPGWCGGISGSWGWSANVNILGFGASFAGGGAFNVGAGCGYIPPPLPPVNPLPIYSPGYQPVYASDYFEPQGCGCVYADNTYLYGNYQQVEIQGVPQQAFVPTSYTPDIVFQQPTEGLPPFMTGDEPVSVNWFTRQPAVLWVSVGVVMLGLMGLAYVNRERLIGMLR